MNEILAIVFCCVFPATFLLILITSSLFPGIAPRDEKRLARHKVFLQGSQVYLIPFLKEKWPLLALSAAIGAVGLFFLYAMLFHVVFSFIFAFCFLFSWDATRRCGYLDTNMGIFLRGSVVYRLTQFFFLLIYVGATCAPLAINNPAMDIFSP